MAAADVWGVQLIDEALGEMPTGFPVLVSGDEGSGRTTLAVQLAEATLRRGGRVVMVTSHPAELVLQRAASMGLDWQTELRIDQLMLFGLEAPARLDAERYASALREQLEAACERPNLVIFDGLAPLEARADALALESCVERVFSYGGPTTRRIAFTGTDLPGRLGSALHAVASAAIRLEGRPGVRQLVVAYQRFGPTLPGPVPYDIGAMGLVPDGLVAADAHPVIPALPAADANPALPPADANAVIPALPAADAHAVAPARPAPPASDPDLPTAADAPNAASVTLVDATEPPVAESEPAEGSDLDDAPVPVPAAAERPAHEVAEEILAANALAEASREESSEATAEAMETTQVDLGDPATATSETEPGPNTEALEAAQVDMGERAAARSAVDDDPRPRILVISNEHANWRTLRADLDEVLRMEFVEPGGGRDLATSAADHDAVLVDAASMGSDSEELLTSLREQGVPGPVVVVTNRHRRSFDRVVTLLRGADDLLPWPPEPGPLRQRLETAIRNRAEGRSRIDRSASHLLPRTTGWRLLDEGSFLELVQRGNQLSAELNLSSSVLSIVASDLTLVSPLIEVIEEELRDSDVLHLVDGGRVLVYLPLTAPDDLKPVLQRLSDGLRAAHIEPLAFRISAHAGDETSRERLASTLGLNVDRPDDADFPVVVGERDEDADLPRAMGPDEGTTS